MTVHRVAVSEFEAMLLDGRVMDNCTASGLGRSIAWRDRQPLAGASRYGRAPSFWKWTAVARGTVAGVAAPMNSTAVLLLSETQTFPESSTAMPVGPVRGPPVLPARLSVPVKPLVGESATPRLENSEMELPLPLAIQMFPEPSMASAAGVLRPPPE